MGSTLKASLLQRGKSKKAEIEIEMFFFRVSMDEQHSKDAEYFSFSLRWLNCIIIQLLQGNDHYNISQKCSISLRIMAEWNLCSSTERVFMGIRILSKVNFSLMLGLVLA